MSYTMWHLKHSCYFNDVSLIEIGYKLIESNIQIYVNITYVHKTNEKLFVLDMPESDQNYNDYNDKIITID